MATQKTFVIDEDLVRLYGDYYDRWTGETKPNRVVRTLYWGDQLFSIAPTKSLDAPRHPDDLYRILHPSQLADDSVKTVDLTVYNPGTGKYVPAVIKKKSRGRGKYRPVRLRSGPDPHLLEVTFVDVQQGDATIIRTPDRSLIVVDGGEERFVRAIMAAMFPGTTSENPLIIDAMVVTHGDADHFEGLVTLANAHSDPRDRKRIFTRASRVFHNGLVKAPKKIVERGKERNRRAYEMFGKWDKDPDGKKYVVSLLNDPRKAAKKNQNKPFQQWSKALDILTAFRGVRHAKKLRNEEIPRVKRLEFGNDSQFDVFRPYIDIQVLGPITGTVNGKRALEMLRGETGGLSASHTINGHSVVLRMKYGNVHFMLGGDLNTDAEERLLHAIEEFGGPSLRSEIFKVPHHGSHEFAPEFLEAVSPVVSIVSSGDENRMKEYVHPRANLMAALGRYSRGPEPLVYSTELAAFFAYRKLIQPEQHRVKNGKLVPLPAKSQRRAIHAFQRLVFGAVRVRTDGRRVLTAVESANDGIKEAYAFRVNVNGKITKDESSMV